MLSVAIYITLRKSYFYILISIPGNLGPSGPKGQAGKDYIPTKEDLNQQVKGQLQKGKPGMVGDIGPMGDKGDVGKAGIAGLKG